MSYTLYMLSNGACRPPPTRACRPMGHVFHLGILSTGPYQPLGHGVQHGMSFTQTCPPQGHIVHWGMLSTGACHPLWYVAHLGILSTGAYCIELGTLIGPGEDKNRNKTSMSETRIKLSYNECLQGLSSLRQTNIDIHMFLWFCKVQPTILKPKFYLEL